MACIGDEIDAHLLGGAGLAAVHETDQHGAVTEPGGSHQPMPARSTQAGELDFAIKVRVRTFQSLQRAGWAIMRSNRTLDILSKKRRAE